MDTTSTPEDIELRHWFEAYRQAFVAGAEATAACYHVPCVTSRGGTVRALNSADEIVAFWRDVMAIYASRSYANGHVAGMSTRRLGSLAREADVTWDYVDAQGRSLHQLGPAEWRRRIAEGPSAGP